MERELAFVTSVQTYSKLMDRQKWNNYHGITLLSVPGKVVAHSLLMWIRSHLLKHQRPEQLMFTAGKSTTDRVLALRVLVERRLEFRQACSLCRPQEGD